MRRNVLALAAISALSVAVPLLFACDKATPVKDSASIAGTTLVSTTGGDGAACSETTAKTAGASCGSTATVTVSTDAKSGSCCSSGGEAKSTAGTQLISTDAKEPGAIDTAQHMTMLKALAGKWESTKPGPDGNKGKIEFRSSSNGSVIVETMFPGQEFEMTNMYVVDGNRILMTHYCAGGNQPRMQLVHSDGKTMRFEFVDATNLASRDADYMGALELTITGPDQIQEKWTSFKGGKAEGEQATFDMVRVK